MPFSSEAWDRNAKAYETIRTMPFNTELAAGTLPRASFEHYMIQDAHYLVGYARALALAAARAPEPEQIIQWADAAKTAIVVERALHGSFFTDWGIEDNFHTTPVTPATSHYVSFLVATAYGEPYEIALAAILPCFWIYAEVGKDIAARAAPNNPYQAWIDTYSGEVFDAAVKAAIAATDHAAELAGAAKHEAMHEAFSTCTRLEWMFWDSAYRRASWPV
ncbi:MAG: TenA family protein [Pseudomonadota bacterium]